MSTLPLDTRGASLQALRLRAGGACTLNVTNTSTRNATPFDPETQVIQVLAEGPCWVRTGGADVTAAPTDHFLYPRILYQLSLGGRSDDQHRYLAAIREPEFDGVCPLHISEME